MRKLFSVFWVLALLFPAPAANAEISNDEQAQSLLHLLDYIGVEYPQFVQNGKVINTKEYAEQLEFSGQVKNQIAKLPAKPGQMALIEQAGELAGLIQKRANGEQVSALARQIRGGLIKAYDISTAPKRSPDLRAAATLYSSNCAACHGAEGQGNGPLAASLNPQPSNFHDRERQSQRSVFALYNTIGLGVKGTAMPTFKQLSEDERWVLAFYVSNFFSNEEEKGKGAQFWQEGNRFFSDLSKIVNITPAEAKRESDTAFYQLAFLRSHPSALESGQPPSPLVFARETLQQSLDTYRGGKRETAYQLAVKAYLEGFELAEANIDAVDHGLRSRIEEEMLKYRGAIQSGAPVENLESQYRELVRLLEQARESIENQAESASANFFSALIIILREGLEAILVLAGMAAFLLKTGKREGLAYLHAGWIAALLLGIVTWIISSKIISISGLQRELTEGVTTLLSAAVLLYVGFWLHRKTYAARWNAFIKEQVAGALSSSTLWGLALVSFLAVYREVFETVLFYQALWIQTGATGKAAVVFGLASGAGCLVVLAWMIYRASTKLPIGLFFGISSTLVAGLAVVFSGKGVAALQAAGKLPVDPASFPSLPALGIYPNWQGLILQAVLLCVVIAGFMYSHTTASSK
ncbi:MAG TPA: cytochrome c/FTR1 family iron permease [Burkholderiales bacterium]|nr:cytochrome c/FTR1 family iron permease [Burkholderiales bacterium]